MLYISREVATFTPPKTNILPEAAGFVNTLFTYMPSAYTLHTGIHYTIQSIHARCLHSTYTVFTSYVSTSTNTVYPCQVSTFYIYSLYNTCQVSKIYIYSLQSILVHARCLQTTHTVYILYSYMPGVYTLQYSTVRLQRQFTRGYRRALFVVEPPEAKARLSLFGLFKALNKTFEG